MDPIKPPQDEFSMWDDLKYGLGFPLALIGIFLFLLVAIVCYFI